MSLQNTERPLPIDGFISRGGAVFQVDPCGRSLELVALIVEHVHVAAQMQGVRKQIEASVIGVQGNPRSIIKNDIGLRIGQVVNLFTGIVLHPRTQIGDDLERAFFGIYSLQARVENLRLAAPGGSNSGEINPEPVLIGE